MRPLSSPAPTPASERLHALDAMRGLAILGVLIAYTVWSLGNPPEESWSRADHLVADGMDLLVDTKLLTMFACLFGMGIVQQWQRWEAGGFPVTSLHLRRMGFLLAIGLVHGALLRNGDILAPYAILGLVLLSLRRVPSPAVAALAVVAVLIPLSLPFLGIGWPPRPDAANQGYVLENIAWLAYWYRTNPLRTWPTVFAIMCVGLLLGRSGVLQRLAFDRTAAARAFGVALIAAVLSRLLQDGLGRAWAGAPPTPMHRALGLGTYQLFAWAVAATYATGILLTSQFTAWQPVHRPLRALGRMAFTNYLSQATVIVPLCLLLGLFDHVGPARGLLMAAGLGLIQAAFSSWWLGRHAMGPVERVWRGFTYGPLSAG